MGKRVLCCFCNKPIKAGEVGGMFKMKGMEKTQVFHNSVPCLMAFDDMECEGVKREKTKK